MHLFSFPWWLIWRGQKSHGYINSGLIWKVSYCTVMPCKCHQRTIRFSVTSAFKNFRSVWSVSVWSPRALTLELFPSASVGKGFSMEMDTFEFYLQDLVISFPTQLFWSGDAEKCVKGKMKIRDFKGSVGKQFQLDNSKSMLHISVLRQKKLLLCSLEQCYSKFNVQMNRWGIFLKSRFWFCRSR